MVRRLLTAHPAAVSLVPAALLLCPQALSTGLLVILMSIWALLLLTSLVPVLLFCWRRLRPKAVSPSRTCLGVWGSRLCS